MNAAGSLLCRNIDSLVFQGCHIIDMPVMSVFIFFWLGLMTSSLLDRSMKDPYDSKMERVVGVSTNV